MSMSPKLTAGSFIIISPVKDEARYIETTIRAVVRQTVRPEKWIIVDDGSSDGTPEILEKYTAEYEWIQVLRLESSRARRPGAAVIRAFAAGLKLATIESVEFVVKLDCDVDLPPSYFEHLISKFAADPALGISSGIYLEENQGEWQPVDMPYYHAAGACKVIRSECFRQIRGFVESRGWDTVDEIRAQVLGWQTKHFPDLQFHHLKREGSGIGSIATSVMHGEVYYLTGGGIVFFLFKALHRMISDEPFLISGLALLWGYIKALFSGEAKLVSPEEARLYTRLLNRRIWKRLAGAPQTSPERQGWSCD